MKKKIKFISIIFTFLFIVSILVNESNSFSKFKNTLVNNTSLENTKNITLLATEGNSSTVSTNTEEGKTSDTSNTTDNSDNGNVTNPSGSGETENSTNETGNNGSNAEEPTTPTEPATPSVPTEPTKPSEVVVPVEPTIPKQSEQQSTNTGAAGNTINSSVKSSTGSSTSTSSTKRKTSSGTSSSKSSTSSDSSISTSKSSDEDTVTQNEVVTDSVEQITAPVNNANNAQELAKDENQITIKSSLSKGDIYLDGKSNEIKLTSDNKDLKEIYYVLSNKKNTDSNENWIKYSSSLKFDKKGTWYVHYKAVDKNGKESYGSFGPYNVSSKYETLEAGAADNSLNKKIIGFSMIAVIIILAVIYIVKTNRSPYSKLKNEDNYGKRKMFNFK